MIPSEHLLRAKYQLFYMDYFAQFLITPYEVGTMISFFL